MHFTAFASLVSLLSLLSSSLAQQYAGQTIANSLPATTGAEKAFFNIKDASGKDTTLINYFSLPTTTGKRQDPVKVQRAVIVLSGSNRDPYDYYKNVFNAVKNAAKVDSSISEENVAILAPFWANEADAGRGYPTSGGVSTTNVLIWKGTGWAGGDTNTNPTSQTSVSSFDAMDQILRYFDNKSLYPNLHQIVIAGHSRGAQMAQRYAAVGKQLNLGTPVVYWLGNPNSFLWFTPDRPLSTSSCSIYNNWREGLSGYTNAYENAFVNSNPAGVLARYSSRDIAYARGLNDNGDVSDDCAPYPAGNTRGQRFYNFITRYGADSSDTLDYSSGVGHDAATMMTNTAGVTRIILDNFHGDDSRAADIGPRQIAGDNPHPQAT